MYGPEYWSNSPSPVYVLIVILLIVLVIAKGVRGNL